MPACVTAAGYDAVAEEYSQRLYRELDNKPFDRTFLDRLASRIAEGLVLDIGCGPGHVGKHIAGHGHRVLGADVSEKMVAIARRLNPGLRFEQGDMRRLLFDDKSFAAIVSFYSIIHVAAGELNVVFAEMRRVLQPGGLLAIAFHVGDQILRIDQLWGIKTSLDFVFFQPQQVACELSSAGLAVLESIERAPYDQSIEAQTRRCYMLAQRPKELAE